MTPRGRIATIAYNVAGIVLVALSVYAFTHMGG